MDPPKPERVTKQLPGGFRLKHFEVLELIATGGMGTVYRAMDHSARRTVALKVLRAEFSHHDEYVRMFEDEAYSLARLCHPNIIPVYYAGEEADWLFFAMPLIEGKDCLRILAETGACEPGRVQRWALQAVSALSAAWRCGIMHRDMKPANIIIEDASGNALLADFGLAMIRGVESSRLAEDWGSPGYLAPEQILKEDLDFRTDMYSLGASLFHILAGETPYASKDWRNEIEGHVGKPFPFHLAQLRGVPDGWVEVLARMMEKKRADRYPSYEALEGALRGIDRPVSERSKGREGVMAVPSRPDWPRDRLNGMVRQGVAFWTGIDPGQVVAVSSGGAVSPKEWPPLVSLAPWEWHIRQICEGGEGDPVQLREFAMIMPEYEDFIQRLAAMGWYGAAEPGFEGAMARVGLARCRVLAVACVLIYESSKISQYFDWLPLWRHSVSCGLLAELLLGFFDFPETPRAIAAGLLHDVGKVILGDIAGMGLMAAFRRSLLEGVPLEQCEKESLPCGHVAAGEAYARHLKLPEDVVGAIALHHGEIPKRDGQLVAAVQAANDLCKRHGLGYSGEGVLTTSHIEDCAGLQWLADNSGREDGAMAAFRSRFLPVLGEFPLLASQQVDPRKVVMGEEEVIPFWRME
ncbi:MAG TPA: HDOD domain-containing protein [Verrucomicrobiae bacterium]|nr:HDOD domain-containing protein [Verrucomicrobiae bacterium]